MITMVTVAPFVTPRHPLTYYFVAVRASLTESNATSIVGWTITTDAIARLEERCFAAKEKAKAASVVASTMT